MIKFIKRTVLILVLVLIFTSMYGTKILNYSQVKIKDKNRIIKIYTDKIKVSSVLKKADIKLNKYDLVYPSLDSNITKNNMIEICRVKHIYKTKIKPIYRRPIEVETKILPKGQRFVTNPGANGYMEEIIKYKYMNDQKVFEETVDVKIICKARPKIILKGISDKYYKLSNHIKKNRTMRLHATAYSPGTESCGQFSDGFTSIGLRAGFGIAAVDPKVIPLGTLMYVEGYGYAIAGDVGGAIKEKRIDLCFDNAVIAREFGRKAVNVYILQ